MAWRAWHRTQFPERLKPSFRLTVRHRDQRAPLDKAGAAGDKVHLDRKLGFDAGVNGQDGAAAAKARLNCDAKESDRRPRRGAHPFAFFRMTHKQGRRFEESHLHICMSSRNRPHRVLGGTLGKFRQYFADKPCTAPMQRTEDGRDRKSDFDVRLPARAAQRLMDDLSM